ncbi:MAG: DUF4097 family beta strand repeat-containing protein [Ruminococcus sp.]
MKKGLKVLLIIGTVFTVIGLVTVGVALGLGFAGDFSFASRGYADLLFESSENFDYVEINSADSDVFIEVASADECKVAYSVTDTNNCTVEIRDNTLVIDTVENRQWFEHFFYFDFIDTPSITVYLPERVYERISINNISGEINISDAEADDIYLETASGDIRSDAVIVTDTIEIKTVSGKVFSDCVGHSKKALVSSVSGDITVSNGSFDTLDVKTTSGEVQLSSTGAYDAKIKSTSGDIELYRFGTKQAGARVDIETVSGSVEGHLSYAMRYDVSSVSGELELFDEDINGNTCRVKTTSGDIELYVYKSNSNR